jgi:AGCS family alanine or glycine:cation symporter
MEAQILQVLDKVDGFVWSQYLLIPLLLGTGIYLTLRFLFIQIRHFPHAVAIAMGRYDNPNDEGEIKHFQALSAALSATIGTGNIAGVATAIAAGGPGAVFWMWMTALFGMCLKFVECTLAVKYRVVHADGTVSGGPMYYLEKGLGQKWLGVLFALFAVIASFGIGNMTQINSLAQATERVRFLNASMSPQQIHMLAGVVVAVLVALVILGGIKRIGKVASVLVPFMAVVYIGGALVNFLYNFKAIPDTFLFIFRDAFQPTAAAGGFAGAAVAHTIRYGVARGIFSNESGLGSAPIAHAAARTNEPVREGLVAMMGPFIDTILICSMTAFVVVSSGLWTAVGADGAQLTGAQLTAAAFSQHFPRFGNIIVSLGLLLFTFSTLVSWSYYGDRCASYLFGQGAVLPYRVLFCLVIIVGANLELNLVWTFSDITNGLMALPNLIALLFLGGALTADVRDYFSRQHKRFW